jgi:hypothetical protein
MRGEDVTGFGCLGWEVRMRSESSVDVCPCMRRAVCSSVGKVVEDEGSRIGSVVGSRNCVRLLLVGHHKIPVQVH